MYLNRAPHREGADGIDGTGAQAGPLFFPSFWGGQATVTVYFYDFFFSLLINI